jgi:hypothetical protein
MRCTYESDTPQSKDAGSLAQPPRVKTAAASTVWLPRTLLLGDDALIDEVIAAFRKVATAWG